MADEHIGTVLVRGGTVVDGTGAAGRLADVRVRDGQIVEVAPDLRPDGEIEIDASGATVIPGLIESHTHFDGSLWWDPDCDPMPGYGTTTVVSGNCGLGLAPVRDDDVGDLIDLFCFIEDLPGEAFRSAIPWTWHSWPEYHEVASAHPTGVNFASFFPHQFLRVWAMGPAAWERAATDGERARMREALAEALHVGALGLSTSVMDTDRQNRRVPSRLADDTEFDDLFAELGDHPGSVFQFVPRFMEPEHFFSDLGRFATFAARHDVPTLYAGVRLEQASSDAFAKTARHVEGLQAGGARLTGLMSARPSHVNMHFERSIMWSGVAAWHELVVASAGDKPALLDDPDWRERARTDWDACTYTLVPIRTPERLILVGGRDDGRSLGEVATRDRVHPSDALVEWLRDTRLQGNLRTGDRPIDDASAAQALRSVDYLSGASDAGAHIQMFSGAGDSTYVLAHLARDEALLPLEAAVHAVTGRPARYFGIPDRGVVAPGAVGDLAVFELDALQNGAEHRVFDVPAGGWRYTREPGGYRATIVAGVPTWLDGGPTGARPGTMLRRAGSTG